MGRAVSLGMLALLVACTSDSARAPAGPSADPQAVSGTANGNCESYPPPFAATYLPEGFHPDLREGAGLFEGAGGAAADYPTEGLLGHYRSTSETIHANFEVRPGPLPYEPARPKPVRVLGETGRIGTIEGGFAVEFSMGECDFRMDTYGVSRAQTIRIAKGLAPR